MSGERRTIVVVGAGIGGLSAALALAAVGYRIVVVERAATLSAVGAGIQIAPNAGRILARLGLDTAIGAVAIEPEAIEIRSGVSGKRITAIPGAAFRSRYGFPYRVIHRTDLQDILARAVVAHPAIRLELDATVADLVPGDDGMLVHIRKPDGVETVSATAIIAADGVWSILRGWVAGSAAPVATGRTAWRAVVAADVVGDVVAMNRIGLWLRRDAHLVHYPVAQGTAVNIVATVPETWRREGWNAVGDPAELRAHFNAWPKAARALLAMPPAWQKFAIFSVEPSAPWCDGRIALLGDAAHAMVPYLAQGAAMAIEDAAVLADCLKGATDIPAALRAYEGARKVRVRKVTAASATTGARYHLGGPLALARDVALRVGGTRLVLNRNDWIYRFEVGSGD